MAAARKAWRRVRWALAAVLLPFTVLGLAALSQEMVGHARFDPAYFDEPYLERYRTPTAAVRAMESGLRRGDAGLLAELQGLQHPASFTTSSGMAFVELWERRGPYSIYLFLDRQTYKRYLIPFEQVEGRWVAGPRDLRFYLQSGHWRAPFLVCAGAWWGLCAVSAGLLLLGRRSARARL